MKFSMYKLSEINEIYYCHYLVKKLINYNTVLLKNYLKLKY
jgi:hypothetical protein